MNRHRAISPNPSRSEKTLCRTARLVLALPDNLRTEEMRAYFRQQGWDVHIARSSCQVRKLARQFAPAGIILAAEGTDGESGWLTCAKLLMERCRLRVVLMGEEASLKAERQAAFVGAVAYLTQGASVQTIERAVLGTPALSRN
jgi:ActR/RegA family two-component response regulator